MEHPFVEMGQGLTFLYFGVFLLFVPLVERVESRFLYPHKQG